MAFRLLFALLIFSGSMFLQHFYNIQFFIRVPTECMLTTATPSNGFVVAYLFSFSTATGIHHSCMILGSYSAWIPKIHCPEMEPDLRDQNLGWVICTSRAGIQTREGADLSKSKISFYHYLPLLADSRDEAPRQRMLFFRIFPKPADPWASLEQQCT